MLIHQTDYLTIEADKLDYGNSEFISPIRELVVKIYVQCNGKLKRIQHGFGIDGESLQNRNEIYVLRETMKSLGYDMPEVASTITKALSSIFCRNLDCTTPTTQTN